MANRVLVGLKQLGKAGVGKPLALEDAHALGIDCRQALPAHITFKADQFLDLRKEPRVNVGERIHVLQRESGTEGVTDVENAIRPRFTQLAPQRCLVFFAVCVHRERRKTVLAGFQSAQRLLQ